MCGIFGCIRCGSCELDIANIIYGGLLGLQHRGQEATGIVATDGVHETFSYVKENGLVSNVLTERNLGINFNRNLASLGKGNYVGVGHTRYATAGVKGSIACIQPFVVYTSDGKVAVAHNGELVNAEKLRKKLLRKGVGLSTDTDSEIIAQLLALPRKPPAMTNENGAISSEDENEGETKRKVDWMEKIKQTMQALTTSYALVIMTKDSLFAARDPYGNRPLSIGKLEQINGELAGYVVSSETCSFNAIGAQLVREVDVGEIVEITTSGIGRSVIIDRPRGTMPAFCIFEYVYFAKSDSVMEGQQVHKVRYECGIQLAREAKVDADIVSTVPDSATPAALGYSYQTGIPYMEVLSKNTYVGRSFIQPSIQLRQLSVTKKFGPLFENFRNKRVVLIDDSIVRGTTMRQIVKLLKTAGATEVHIRVASPPIRFPCFMGINIPTKEELIANLYEQDDLPTYFGADSVKYLTVDGLVSVVERRSKGKGHCVACLNGDYPVKLDW